MRLAPGRNYIVGYVRELQLPEKLRRLRTQFHCQELYEYRGVHCLFGVTARYQLRVPERPDSVVNVPPRSASFAVPQGDLEPFVMAAVRALRGDDIYIEEPEAAQRVRVLNLGTCRQGAACDCDRYHGPVDPTAWTKSDHQKKNVYLVDRFLQMKESGELMRGILLNGN